MERKIDKGTATAAGYLFAVVVVIVVGRND